MNNTFFIKWYLRKYHRAEVDICVRSAWWEADLVKGKSDVKDFGTAYLQEVLKYYNQLSECVIEYDATMTYSLYGTAVERLIFLIALVVRLIILIAR